MREGGLILTQPRTSVISFNEYSDIVVHSHFWISLQSYTIHATRRLFIRSAALWLVELHLLNMRRFSQNIY